MQNIQLKAEGREGLGKRAVASLRADGKVPGVVQEHGKESLSILVDGREILKAFAGAEIGRAHV